MTEASDNPVKIIREALDDPMFKDHICEMLRVPPDTEIDEQSFEHVEQLFKDC